ncbi:hypothetical protein ACFCYH_20780 [Streptomyces sp. NPDC056400]|uniref:hypothetical protein n=1 Tax=Streptomyces sp. NPDC056400 TaxID=3345808 RepID=UPI0035DEBDCF
MAKTPYAAPATARPTRWTALVLAGAALVPVTAGTVRPHHAVDTAALTALMKPGAVVRGRTGSMGRSTSGVFAAGGGRRTVVHSLLPAGEDRELVRGHITAPVGAAL